MYSFFNDPLGAMSKGMTKASQAAAKAADENKVVEVYQIPYFSPDSVDSFHESPKDRYKLTSLKTLCYHA